MNSSYVILFTLIAYKVILVGIGFWAHQRTANSEDFFLGGRRLGGWVAALSASASSSSAWTLLGVSGAAYMTGMAAIWLLPSVMMGFLVNWLWLAPRLRRLAQGEGAITMTDMMVTEPGSPLTKTIRRAASLIIIFSFIFYIASQFQAAGDTFAATFELSATGSIILGASIIMIYTLLGGFWAVSVTDTLQGLLMVASAVLLPIAALIFVGGPADLVAGLEAAGVSGLTGVHGGLAALGFIVGTMGIGTGYPGQPHVVVRFMALRSEKAVNTGKIVALSWAMIVYTGMLLLGWCARIMFPVVDSQEQVLFSVAQELFNPIVAGIIIAAVLSAIMSTADSQILVTASSVAYDLRRSRQNNLLVISRVSVVVICILSTLLALFAPDSIFQRVLFAWHALGSAFGPILIVRLLPRFIPSMTVLMAMVTGFGLTVWMHSLPNAPGDWLERLVPFFIALLIALLGSRAITKPQS